MADRIIEKKKWSSKRILTIVGIVALIALIVGSFYFTSGGSKLNVEEERITISEVSKGPFQELISVNGVVLPITTIYLDAIEGGRVEERYVEDGAIMKKGQPILKLSNSDLLMNMVSQQNTVYNTLTQMQINKNAASQNTVVKLNQMADVESLYKEAERLYRLNKKLYEEKAIGFQEFKKSENDYNYYLQKRNLTQQILQQDSLSRNQQEAQDKRSYAASQNALDIMQKKVNDLIVRAPVDGQLTSLDAEVGQNKNKGERLGQIDVMSGFKVRVDIDEHYITRIYAGLVGQVQIGDAVYKLKISKVYTQVTNSRFQVDMQFEGKVPENVRRGQSLQIRLALSDEKQAIRLPRGGFFTKTGGNWVYKLSADGTTAYKVDIVLGSQNPDYFEVVKGLEVGDKVITSSYDNYENIQELVIKKK